VALLKNKADQLSACVDANVYISAIAFGGKPLKVVERALNREYLLIAGANILTEVRRNLLGKLGLEKDRVDQFLTDVSAVSSVFVPSGGVDATTNAGDNLVLEVALMGGADVLVTGDKKHLLPLGSFHGITIEPPSAFLARLDAIK
jgi:putative PIN family toxin of toxin-antitoxin system